MERDKDTKEDLKTVALGTSKINYLDPRISVAWCKRQEVPIEKVNSFCIIFNTIQFIYFFTSESSISSLMFPILCRYSISLSWQNLPGQWTFLRISDSDSCKLCSPNTPLPPPFHWKINTIFFSLCFTCGILMLYANSGVSCPLSYLFKVVRGCDKNRLLRPFFFSFINIFNYILLTI